MSLTLIVDRKSKDVAIVEWFRDRNHSLTYPSGALREMSYEEFRKSAQQIIVDHFKTYADRRLLPEEVCPVFVSRSEKSYLTGRVSVWIRFESEGKIRIIPQYFSKPTLDGAQNLSKDTHRLLEIKASQHALLAAIDDAISLASSV
jgi:hypothetical protein